MHTCTHYHYLYCRYLLPKSSTIPNVAFVGRNLLPILSQRLIQGLPTSVFCRQRFHGKGLHRWPGSCPSTRENPMCTPLRSPKANSGSDPTHVVAGRTFQAFRREVSDHDQITMSQGLGMSWVSRAGAFSALSNLSPRFWEDVRCIKQSNVRPGPQALPDYHLIPLP